MPANPDLLKYTDLEIPLPTVEQLQNLFALPGERYLTTDGYRSDWTDAQIIQLLQEENPNLNIRLDHEHIIAELTGGIGIVLDAVNYQRWAELDGTDDKRFIWAAVYVKPKDYTGPTSYLPNQSRERMMAFLKWHDFMFLGEEGWERLQALYYQASGTEPPEKIDGDASFF